MSTPALLTHLHHRWGAGLWFLGFALGIALILRGWSNVMFAFAVRSFGHNVALRPAA
jgi:uncharacterized membrane protein HdeD (DUF308 family)